MTAFVGFNPSETYTSAQRISSGKGWALGNIVRDQAGNEWIYVQAGASCPQYNIVRVLTSAQTAAPLASAGTVGS